jgi:hypothetical protein
MILHIRSDFEICADILTSSRTPA